MNYSAIYLITNKINNKKYIGQSIEPYNRWESHKKSAIDSTSYDYNIIQAVEKAMRKYGVDNFSFKVIEEVPEDVLDEREIYWIDYYNTFKGEGYNLTKGGHGLGRGKTHVWYNKTFTKEHRNKLIKARTGQNNGMYGRKHTEESKRKMSKFHKGKTISEKTKQKIRKSTLGNKNHNHKLDKIKAIRIIKEYYETDISQGELGKKFNVTGVTIGKVINCKHWTTRDLKRSD